MTSAFCFDLDGTVTAREVIPMIAAEVGYYEELHALTEATIKGIIPFESSFRLRCKILADVPVSRVREIVRTAPLFPMIAEFIRTRPDNCYIVTGNLDVWVEPLISTLGARFFSSIGLVEDDRLVRVGRVLDKGDAIAAIRASHDRVVAIGDGMGDVAMFEKADVRIAFGGVHAPIETLVQLSDIVCLSEIALCNVLTGLS